MKPKEVKLTYRECAKDLRKLRNRKKLGHQQTLMFAILELEKLARKEEAAKTVKPCFLKPRQVFVFPPQKKTK